MNTAFAFSPDIRNVPGPYVARFCSTSFALEPTGTYSSVHDGAAFCIASTSSLDAPEYLPVGSVARVQFRDGSWSAMSPSYALR